MAKISFPKIVQKDWIELHPYINSQPTDFYYIKLANRLSKVIAESNFGLSPYCTKQMALNVSSYFEDVISELGLWRAFTTLHQQRFGKRLPFYDITESEYYPDEINYPDIWFIIWMTFQQDETSKRKTVKNPENPGLEILAELINDILEEQFEQAPVNEFMFNLLSLMTNADNFLTFRNFATWIFYHSYLMRPFSKTLLKEELEEEEEILGYLSVYQENKKLFRYALHNRLIFTMPCGPLAMPMYEWLSVLCPDNKDNGKTNTNIDNLFLVKENNVHSILVESDQGELYDIDPLSIEDSHVLIPNKSAFIGFLVKFGEQWNLNGMFIPMDDNDFQIHKEKQKETSKAINAASQVFGSGMDKQLLYSKNMEEIAPKLSQLLNYPTSGNIPDYARKLSNFVTFFDEQDGFVSFPELALAITDPANPLFDKDKASDMTIQILLNIQDCHKNLLRYLLDRNYLSEFALNSLHGHEHGKELAQKNLEFLFRFFRPDLF